MTDHQEVIEQVWKKPLVQIQNRIMKPIREQLDDQVGIKVQNNFWFASVTHVDNRFLNKLRGQLLQ